MKKVLIFLLLTTATCVHAKNIYVAPDGNDGAAGTIDSPCSRLVMLGRKYLYPARTARAANAAG